VCWPHAYCVSKDFTKRVSVLKRLLATMASGVLASLLTGVTMQDCDGFWLLAAITAAHQRGSF